MKTRTNPLLTDGQQLTEQAERHFQIAGRSHTTRQKKERMKAQARSRARKLIRPANCQWILKNLPKAGETLHGITPGNFVFGDLVEAILIHRGRPDRLDITTLSMSEKNVRMFRRILESNPALPIGLLLSAYFRDTNGQIFSKITELASDFAGRLVISAARIHTKLMLFDYSDRPLVVEGSANLRSSDNVEQFTMLEDRHLLDFHRAWITELTDTTAVQWED